MSKSEKDEERDAEREEEKLERKKVELLKQKSKRLKCPVCGAPARLRLEDGAVICREGGHVTQVDERVWLQGVETTLRELREKGIDLYVDREKKEEGTIKEVGR